MGYTPDAVTVHNGKHVHSGRQLVVNSCVLPMSVAAGSGPARNRVRYHVAEGERLQGHWLPATFVGETAQHRYVWRVAPVSTHSNRQAERALDEFVRAIDSGTGLAELARPATHTVLTVDDKHGVLAVRHLTDHYAFGVTAVTVEPLRRPGKRAQRLATTIRIPTNDLLRVALDHCQVFSVLRRAQSRPYLAQLQLGKLRPGAYQAKGNATDTRERLELVRRAHEAAPHGDKTRNVMTALGLRSISNAERLIRRSQRELGWGKSHERRTSTKQRKTKGSK